MSVFTIMKRLVYTSVYSICRDWHKRHRVVFEGTT